MFISSDPGRGILRVANSIEKHESQSLDLIRIEFNVVGWCFVIDVDCLAKHGVMLLCLGVHAAQTCVNAVISSCSVS